MSAAEKVESAPKPKSYSCSVHLCTSTSTQNDPPQFYSFPKDLEKCSLWVRRCGKSHVSELFRRYGSRRLSKRNTVCSQHFDDNDLKNPLDKSLGLKKGAVPTTNIISYDSESLDSGAEYDSLSLSSDSCPSVDSLQEDQMSDTSEEYYPSQENGKLAEEAIRLRRWIVENERKNRRLKRTIKRLKKQNRVYKKELK